MTRDGAENAVAGSALIVAAIYAYRRLSEVDVQLTNAHGLRLKQLAGAGPVLPTGPFVVGWGLTFLLLSLAAQAAPKVGGYASILVATGAVLGNGYALSQDLAKPLGAKVAPPAYVPVPGSSIPKLQQQLPAGVQYPSLPTVVIPQLQPIPAGAPVPNLK